MQLIKWGMFCLLVVSLIGCGTEKKVDLPNNSALAAETNTGLMTTGNMGSKSGKENPPK